MLNILVVDDLELNRRLLTVMLEQQGYRVFTADNGLNALKLLEENKIDIVLLDVIMPVMDGFETASIIKKRFSQVYLPIIFITSLEDEASFERCLAVGGDDFLQKPFQEVILNAKIKAHSRIRNLSQKAHDQNLQLEYHQNQVEREHEIVEHIFNNALENQQAFPAHLDFHLSPAAMFNGDMFLVAQSPIGSLYCMLGDFTGHGLAAAVGALPASRVFYTMVSKGMSVSDIAAEINTVLGNLLPGHMFCAATILELSKSGRSVSAWLGGLPDIYVINEKGNIARTLESQHMALGILEPEEFERGLIHIEVEPSSRIVMATDGIIETTNLNDEYFGEQRFKKVLASKSYISTEQIIERVNRFARGNQQQDDLSLVLLNCLPVPSPEQTYEQFSPLPFHISMSLNAKQIKSTDPVLEVIELLSKIGGLNDHRANIFLMLSEAYNNALDHGVLGLDSEIKNQEDGFLIYYQQREEALASLSEALIIIDIQYSPETLELDFTICDSGNGFSKTGQSQQNLVREHGRGLCLLSEIASKVSFNSAGNQVEINYKLTASKASSH
ncbi:response regulator [Pseudoalteromonas sp. MEBiC 03607]|mgnify:FL=1|uniref:ATP-binding SpoIIE family protein phosphatase n=1 Tax=Pseudoalteromonas sp. MEBiC 03607 TaxID=2563601 RepID=UPI000C6B0537|nr:fused response regulator/phosphatase [Pseudoalteromonas sp. MEBiC 03607]MBD56720.1 fused response regulator/phosphatase [Pseudoalteromonas sp.]MBU75672.1 fused response regulator/phosphatase [Pseudoalteromonadaceae bacterium]TGV19935.1 response regulator [Pseudoalteromonas sp. MEBiC 03607]|tara:strand:- start:767 stop:2437 length:1671 start_codon:yes stop_codon:yes gene_type:complete